MDKNKRNYIVIWVLILVLFNVVVFALPHEIAGVNRFTSSFWISYVTVHVSFIIQLVCAYYVFSGGGNRIIYRFSIFSISIICLLSTIVLSAICMFVPQLPNWLVVIACVLVMSIFGFFVINTQTAINIVEKLEDKTESDTKFIRSMIIEFDTLLSKVSGTDLESPISLAYDSFRYSPKLSNSNSLKVERDIEESVLRLKELVEKKDGLGVKKCSEDIVALIEERNKLIKSTK